MSIDTKQFDEVARRAVGTTLLFRKSKTGGSHGKGIDEARAEELLPTLDAESFYALLVDVAREATKEAKHTAAFLRSDILEEAKRVAVNSDSLTLWRFIESQKGV